jgi:Uma2 family endonuclease
MARVFDHDIHRMSVEAYEQYVADQGLDRTELIDGVIHNVSPQSALHLRAVLATCALLKTRFPDRFVSQGCSVRLGDGSLWEPDVFVLGALPDDGYVNPQNVVLAVEVALSTWSKDTTLKLAGYARSGIGEYWVLDPRPGGKLIRYTEPDGADYGNADVVPLPDGLASLG